MTFTLHRCSVTKMIDCHLVLKSASFRFPSSSLVLFASLFKYFTTCLPQRSKCFETRGMTNGRTLLAAAWNYTLPLFSSRFLLLLLLCMLPSLSPNTMDEPMTHLIQCLHLHLGQNENVRPLVTVDILYCCSSLCSKLS